MRAFILQLPLSVVRSPFTVRTSDEFRSYSRTVKKTLIKKRIIA